ncbi:META domain-containing protein [Sulfitobacter sp. S190]|uniref:META domain-containing protein n=1 Tax=Sulfitobacter sp. S190 TaxID=2867022 RepID=UPI0021A5B278|nr:META domain-containing protein [Sulfitobacter sp. S190]UWR22909.1 META domain-containing protein [Sulfitobacter sp. S190]
MKLALLSLATAALLGACQGDETVRAYGGADRVWLLETLDGAPFADRATLTFPETGRIAGDAPCNSYTAAMTAPYPWFDTGPIAATRRSCPALAAETAYLAALDAAALSEVAGDTLILSNTDGLSMVFKAAE